MATGKPSRRPPWGIRAIALAASIGVFAGYWRLAVLFPHPDTTPTTVNTTAGDGGTYTLPTTGKGNNPLPLPTPVTSSRSS